MTNESHVLFRHSEDVHNFDFGVISFLLKSSMQFELATGCFRCFKNESLLLPFPRKSKVRVRCSCDKFHTVCMCSFEGALLDMQLNISAKTRDMS